jgi:UDP-GlcNAc:undecaprenyl-phosphate GlcNAc-1-phosphate transferase
MLEIGHTHRRAVLLLYFWSALLAGGGVTLSISQRTTDVFYVIGVLAVLGIVVSLIPRFRSAVLERRASR